MSGATIVSGMKVKGIEQRTLRSANDLTGGCGGGFPSAIVAPLETGLWAAAQIVWTAHFE